MEAVCFSGSLECNYQVIRLHNTGYHAIDINIFTARYGEIKRSWNFHFIWLQVIINPERSILVSFQFRFHVFSVLLAARNVHYMIMVEEETLNLQLYSLSDVVYRTRTFGSESIIVNPKYSSACVDP
jgi:hypothetical protein